ncbi:MAG TPA: hypothetical protein PLY70_17020 [Saprospiraceae bacterium]|nr:hypothetical protein [Saprospiraceae bacterium]
MYKIFLAIFALAILFSACDNDLDLVENGEPITVVYALFDVNDTAHYARVEKAFVDPDVPPATLALDPQNLYFDNLDVTFFKTSNGANPRVLTRVDGNQEGYVRSEGAFAQAPNYLYKMRNTNLALNYVDSFSLQVDLGEGKFATGTTKMVEPAVLIRPNENGSLDFDDQANARYSWNPGLNSVIHSMTLVLKYDENKAGVVSPKTLNWNIFSNITADRFEFAGREFYQLIGANIPIEAGTTRIFKGIDVIFTSAGQSVADYIRVGQANLGITSSGEVPVFTNLTSGRGIVGSRAKRVLRNLQLSRNSIDRLKTTQFTKDLNFQ